MASVPCSTDGGGSTCFLLGWFLLFCLVVEILYVQVNYLHFKNESEPTGRGGKPRLWLPWQHHPCTESDCLQFYLFHSLTWSVQVLPVILLLIPKGHEDRRNCLKVPGQRFHIKCCRRDEIWILCL